MDRKTVTLSLDSAVTAIVALKEHIQAAKDRNVVLTGDPTLRHFITMNDQIITRAEIALAEIEAGTYSRETEAA